MNYWSILKDAWIYPYILGRELKIFIFDENNGGIRGRTSFRFDRVRSKNPIRERPSKRRLSDSVRNTRRQLPGPKGPKMTAEDLDRELESFMKPTQHKRIVVD